MKAWTLFPVISAPMPYQMALDEIIFRASMENTAARPVLRIYFSSEPWTTVGYSDPGPFSLDEKICKRMTGGGRVSHGRDVIFSLTARKDDDETFKSVSASYWKIHEAVKTALEKLGEKPRFYRCDEKLPKGGECFVFPIATDLELDGHKVAGGAQKRSLGVLLHQESIQIPSRMDAFVFADALRDGFKQVFEVTFPFYEIDSEILKTTKELAARKYQHPELLKKVTEQNRLVEAGV